MGKAMLEMLSALLTAKGIQYAVISPGSRNAPLIAALNRNPHLRCLSVVDERSAAYFALGIAQQLRKPVAITCTSGTAPLNYAPAVAEAYYQQVPLLILTADRPPEWVDQGDGQVIRQHNIYASFVRKNVQLPSAPYDNNVLQYANRLINECIDACLIPVPGPVHLNIPLSEPLYGQDYDQMPAIKSIHSVGSNTIIAEEFQNELLTLWHSSNKKLIITGLMHPDVRLNDLLNALSLDSTVVVFTETTSNVAGSRFFPNIDPMIEGLVPDEQYVPDLLVTMGGHIISRKIKTWIQQGKPAMHWHISNEPLHLDAFRRLTHTIQVSPHSFLAMLLEKGKSGSGNYSETWARRYKQVRDNHRKYLQQCEWSDLRAYGTIVNNLPTPCMIQAGNSTPARYLQLFDMPPGVISYANRGVSGIDGCLSTAAGTAYVSKMPVVHFSGDVSFFYDSNALWNKHLTPNLRIVVFNNGGGNIFRIIEGPDSMPEMEEFMETPYIPDIGSVASLYGLGYFAARNEEELKNCLPAFFAQNSTHPLVLEIITGNKTSATVLRNYFKFINQ